ncbi:MAG: PAS domain-containing protein [Desulfobacterales bacterium]|nr:PAS domain-containing protein [Desulfobacterales bacterium]MBS3755183.1 PAS domain-containing protein [Desulfobacterales bacterium]
MIKKKHLSLYISPWMIISAAAILLVVAVTLAVSNYNREKHYMSEILLEKGSALIKSFEAGTRTGMRAMGWGENQVQYLLQELADQADVLYIAVTDDNGQILAHSDPNRIGEQFPAASETGTPAAGQSANWRLTTAENDLPAFEVYRFFDPFTGRSGHMRQMGHMGHMRQTEPRGDRSGQTGPWCAPDNFEKNRQIIFIGFDRTPFIQARRQDFRNTALISSVLLVLGFAGFMTMFVAQHYRATRRRLQDTSAIADEVVASLPVGLMVTDHKGNILLANPAAQSITGLDAQQVRGRPAGEVLPENLINLISPDTPGPRVIEQELACRFGQAEPVPMSVSSARIVNEDGVFVGSLVIFRDLTEIKALQEAMQRKERLAAIGDLAAGIAHEIRNPLSSVKGMATYFKNKSADDPEAKAAAEVMVQETDRLNRVISELLEFARPSSIDARPADINTILVHSIRLIRQDAENQDVPLKISSGENLPLADIDPDRFIQCLLNLYLNAIQAMESGGELAVESSRSAEGEIVIRVSDTGPGIDKENLSQIFDPYFTTKSTGTGLGLAIVHKIVESHEGRITVKSTPGKGTVFTVVLPASRDRQTKEA